MGETANGNFDGWVAVLDVRKRASADWNSYCGGGRSFVVSCEIRTCESDALLHCMQSCFGVVVPGRRRHGAPQMRRD